MWLKSNPFVYPVWYCYLRVLAALKSGNWSPCMISEVGYAKVVRPALSGGGSNSLRKVSWADRAFGPVKSQRLNDDWQGASLIISSLNCNRKPRRRSSSQASVVDGAVQGGAFKCESAGCNFSFKIIIKLLRVSITKGGIHFWKRWPLINLKVI